MNNSRFYKVLELAFYILIVAVILIVTIIQRGKPQEEETLPDMPGITHSIDGGTEP